MLGNENLQAGLNTVPTFIKVYFCYDFVVCMQTASISTTRICNWCFSNPCQVSCRLSSGMFWARWTFCILFWVASSHLGDVDFKFIIVHVLFAYSSVQEFLFIYKFSINFENQWCNVSFPLELALIDVWSWTGVIGFCLQNQRWPWVRMLTRSAYTRRLGGGCGVLPLFNASMLVLDLQWFLVGIMGCWFKISYISTSSSNWQYKFYFQIRLLVMSLMPSKLCVTELHEWFTGSKE